MRVETARGAMAVDGLGTTLMREHVFVLTPCVEAILRAVGQTHVETGTPITVRQLQGLKDAGVDEAQITAMLVHNPAATSPEARSEPNSSYRDSPYAQPLPASGCSG